MRFVALCRRRSKALTRSVFFVLVVGRAVIGGLYELHRETHDIQTIFFKPYLTLLDNTVKMEVERRKEEERTGEGFVGSSDPSLGWNLSLGCLCPSCLFAHLWYQCYEHCATVTGQPATHLTLTSTTPFMRLYDSLRPCLTMTYHRSNST